MKQNKFELYSLTLSVVIPFLLIVIIVYPYSTGVHGTTHSEYHLNDGYYKFVPRDNKTIPPPGSGGDYRPKGHFTGNLYVDTNTGWIFCNGKVRFWDVSLL